MDLKELILRIKGDPKGATDALGKVQAATSKFGGVVKAVITGAAVAGMVKFGQSCINAAGEAQQGETLLRNSLGNIKGMTDKAKDAAVEWVNKMESAKSFDDSEISASLQQLTTKTGDLAKGQEAVSVAMELARFKGIDLAAATTLVDQAYNGSARALKQFGIEAGPDGKAQTGMAALHALQEKVKGSGDAWSKTLDGQREAFKTTFGNFQESVGGFLMPIATKFMDVIQPFLQKGMSWIADHLPQIQAVIDTLVRGVSCVVETAGKMYTAIKPFIVGVTEVVGPYIKDLFDWLNGHGATLQNVLVGVAKAVGTAFQVVAAVITGIVDAIKWIIANFKQASKNVDAVFSSKGDVLSTGRYTASSGAITPHAAGGWVGLNGPEIALVGEKGPEYITPAGQTGASDSLLRELISEVHVLRKEMYESMGQTARGIGKLAGGIG